jgi:hypothetical protein
MSRVALKDALTKPAALLAELRGNDAARSAQGRNALLLHQQNVHGDIQLLPARANNNSVHWRHIGEITAYREHDVIVADQEIIGGIQTDPAKFVAAPHRYPGVRRVRAGESLSPGRWDGPEVAADISRR